MEKKKFDPGTELLGCFQMVKAALTPVDKSDKFDKIKVTKLLGSGAQGNVYRGFCGNEEVAIKKFKTLEEVDEQKLRNVFYIFIKLEYHVVFFDQQFCQLQN